MSIISVLKKFSLILSRHQKVRIAELIVLMIIGGFVEMLSVALIVPFTEAVMNPDSISSISYVIMICQIFHLDSHRMFLVFLAILMALVYIIKNVFLLFQMNIQQRFVYHNRFRMQQKLLKSYLSRPYEYYLNINSGEVLRIVGSDTREAFTLLASLLMLFAELVVSITLIGTVFVIAPGVTLGMAVLLLFMMFVLMKIIRPILSKAGISNQIAYSSMNQWLLQSIQGIKELKILRKEHFFEHNFEKNGHIYVKTSYKRDTLGLVPRFAIEAAAMSSFFLVIAFMIYRSVQLDTLVPVLSSVAVASVRLLPSVNRISQSMADISFREPMLDKVIESLQDVSACEKEEELKKAEEPIICEVSKLSLSHTTYHYPKSQVNVLDDASMVIQKGQSVGIVGTSGAGKTTLVDILLGLLQPQEGRVLVNDVDIKEDMSGWLSRIGYIPQTIFILDGDIRANVAFGIEPDRIDDEAVWRALKEAALDEFVHSLPEGLSTQLGERGVRLSGGQRQRIGIARALYHNPEILFFDEATSALDNETETAIINSINQLQGFKTLIIIAHRLSTIAGCDVVYRVEDGKVRKERGGGLI